MYSRTTLVRRSKNDPVLLLYQIVPITLCPVESLSPAFPQMGAPLRRRTRLEATPPTLHASLHQHSPERPPYWSLGLKYAVVWSVYQSTGTLAHSPPIICIPTSSLCLPRTKTKTRILRPIVILPTSRRLSAKPRFTLLYSQPLVTSVAKRAQVEVKSARLLILTSSLATRRMGCIWRVRKHGRDFELRYVLHHYTEFGKP